MNKLDHKNVGIPMTPGNWSSMPEYHKYLEVTMTCGGGMGGSKWKEYIEDQKLPSNQIIKVQDIGGKTFLINTAYVVKAELVTVVTAAYKSGNPNYPKGSYRVRWIIPDEWQGEIRLSNQYDSNLPDYGKLDC